MPLADFPEIKSLSTEEKLQLVEELWIDIQSSPDRNSYEQRLREEIDRRLAKFDANPESGLTLDEVTANVRKAIENARRAAHSA
ncbi:MAG: addiction module protein [Planctomycetaceae bacterium]